MPYLNVKRCCALTLACALVTLMGCGAGRVVYKDRLVEVPVAVSEPIDRELTKDCEPRSELPYGKVLFVEDALRRLAAVEEALAQCRAQLREIRTIK